MMGLSRVNHTHRKPFVDETRSQTHPIRSGCFHDHEDLAWYNAGRLELVQKTGIAFGRLIDRKRPTGFRPGSLGSNHCGLCGNIDPNEKRICKYCLVCMHSNLPLLQVFPGFSLGCLTPTVCQRSSARDAWSTPQDTVQSSDNLESWGTLFAPRSRPPLSYGPHHDPGVTLIIQAILMLIIRAGLPRLASFTNKSGEDASVHREGQRVRRLAVKTHRPALRAILALGPYGGSRPARVTMRNTEASVPLSLPTISR